MKENEFKDDETEFEEGHGSIKLHPLQFFVLLLLAIGCVGFIIKALFF
jgi:hypothetical protein